MFEIIFDGIVFDPALIYFGGSTTGSFLYAPHRMLIQGGESTFASYLATNVPPSETIIADFNEAVKNIKC